jgi:hypothetical protein
MFSNDPAQYPVINPDDQTQASPLAQALLANQNNPDAWVWTPILDWSSQEAKDIRYEISGLIPDHTVQFRGAFHQGRRGTIMHIVHRDTIQQRDAQ